MSQFSRDKKKRRAQRKRKHGSGNGNDSNVVPLFGTATRHLTPRAFESWLRAEAFPDDEEAVTHIGAYAFLVLDAIAQVNPGFDRLAWTTDNVDAMVSMLNHIESNQQQDAKPIAVAIETMRRYLVETGMWLGTESVSAYAAEQFALAAGLEFQTTTIEEVDEATERAALLDTRPLRRVTELLDWLGPHRPTTQSRWLKPADARDLARRLDIDFPAHVKSMSNVPSLHHLWEFAQVLEIVEANTSSARPGRAARLWRAEPPLDVLRVALTAWVRSGLPRKYSPDIDFSSSLIGVIVSGLGDSPLSIAEIDAWVPKLGLSEFLVEAIHRRLELYIDEGWLTLEGDRYVVPVALRPAVVSALPLPGPP
ncbi:hypothetical protein CYJ73_07725 [Gordonia terrae]|uniref:Uncharacterized protein n=1 Tax=Gordonia terrae TaxID=2055 RepID=A0A2I1RAB9_9ACTN|nr:hypothetical protein [Gordonia terrae]PKZ66026.1 hypothetical protein CYJ73_07725 [Gordonia terrae]